MSRITLTLDSHKLSAFQACERRFYYQHVLNIESAEIPVAISKGTFVHKLLEFIYSCKIKRRNFEKVVKRVIWYAKLLQNGTCKLPADDYILCIAKILEYLSYYRNDSFKPRAVEKGFSKIIYEDPFFLFVYEGRLDLIAQDKSDESWAWIDFKTESQHVDLFQKKNQFIGYSWALGCHTGIIDYVGLQKTLGPKDAFKRTIVNHRQDIIDDWIKDTITWYFRIVQSISSNYWLKNRQSCKIWMERACQYASICDQTSRNVIQQLIKIEYKQKEEWKPW